MPKDDFESALLSRWGSKPKQELRLLVKELRAALYIKRHSCLVSFEKQVDRMITGGYRRSGVIPKSAFPDLPAAYYKCSTQERSAAMSVANQKNQTARQIWLLYFNKTLLERGVITECEHNQMKIKIQAQIAERKKNQM